MAARHRPVPPVAAVPPAAASAAPSPPHMSGMAWAGAVHHQTSSASSPATSAGHRAAVASAALLGGTAFAPLVGGIPYPYPTAAAAAAARGLPHRDGSFPDLASMTLAPVPPLHGVARAGAPAAMPLHTQGGGGGMHRSGSGNALKRMLDAVTGVAPRGGPPAKRAAHDDVGLYALRSAALSGALASLPVPPRATVGGWRVRAAGASMVCRYTYSGVMAAIVARGSPMADSPTCGMTPTAAAAAAAAAVAAAAGACSPSGCATGPGSPSPPAPTVHYDGSPLASYAPAPPPPYPASPALAPAAGAGTSRRPGRGSGGAGGGVGPSGGSGGSGGGGGGGSGRVHHRSHTGAASGGATPVTPLAAPVPHLPPTPPGLLSAFLFASSSPGTLTPGSTPLHDSSASFRRTGSRGALAPLSVATASGARSRRGGGTAASTASAAGGGGGGGGGSSDEGSGGDGEDGAAGDSVAGGPDGEAARQERSRASARARRVQTRLRVEALEAEVTTLVGTSQRLGRHVWGAWRDAACFPAARFGTTHPPAASPGVTPSLDAARSALLRVRAELAGEESPAASPRGFSGSSPLSLSVLESGGAAAAAEGAGDAAGPPSAGIKTGFSNSPADVVAIVANGLPLGVGAASGGGRTGAGGLPALVSFADRSGGVARGTSGEREDAGLAGTRRNSREWDAPAPATKAARTLSRDSAGGGGEAAGAGAGWEDTDGVPDFAPPPPPLPPPPPPAATAAVAATLRQPPPPSGHAAGPIASSRGRPVRRSSRQSSRDTVDSRGGSSDGARSPLALRRAPSYTSRTVSTDATPYLLAAAPNTYCDPSDRTVLLPWEVHLAQCLPPTTRRSRSGDTASLSASLAEGSGGGSTFAGSGASAALDADYARQVALGAAVRERVLHDAATLRDAWLGVLCSEDSITEVAGPPPATAATVAAKAAKVLGALRAAAQALTADSLPMAALTAALAAAGVAPGAAAATAPAPPVTAGSALTRNISASRLAAYLSPTIRDDGAGLDGASRRVPLPGEGAHGDLPPLRSFLQPRSQSVNAPTPGALLSASPFECGSFDVSAPGSSLATPGGSSGSGSGARGGGSSLGAAAGGLSSPPPTLAGSAAAPRRASSLPPVVETVMDDRRGIAAGSTNVTLPAARSSVLSTGSTTSTGAPATVRAGHGGSGSGGSAARTVWHYKQPDVAGELLTTLGLTRAQAEAVAAYLPAAQAQSYELTRVDAFMASLMGPRIAPPPGPLAAGAPPATVAAHAAATEAHAHAAAGAHAVAVKALTFPLFDIAAGVLAPPLAPEARDTWLRWCDANAVIIRRLPFPQYPPPGSLGGGRSSGSGSGGGSLGASHGAGAPPGTRNDGAAPAVAAGEVAARARRSSGGAPSSGSMGRPASASSLTRTGSSSTSLELVAATAAANAAAAAAATAGGVRTSPHPHGLGGRVSSAGALRGGSTPRLTPLAEDGVQAHTVVGEGGGGGPLPPVSSNGSLGDMPRTLSQRSLLAALHIQRAQAAMAAVVAAQAGMPGFAALLASGGVPVGGGGGCDSGGGDADMAMREASPPGGLTMFMHPSPTVSGAVGLPLSPAHLAAHAPTTVPLASLSLSEWAATAAGARRGAPPGPVLSPPPERAAAGGTAPGPSVASALLAQWRSLGTGGGTPSTTGGV